MAGAIEEVLAGEYESGYSSRDGEALTVLDIGANAGAFALWAALRWPGCRVHCYEPHPLTFAMLCGNVGGNPAVTCHNAAVYPLDGDRAPLWARYPGDGEAALVVEAARTFLQLQPGEIADVPIVRPGELPACDIVKLDVEGAEAAILGNMDLGRVSLVLLEYQNGANRTAIEELLEGQFSLAYQDRFAWSALLPESRYRPELDGDSYGHLFFVNRGHNLLRRDAGAGGFDVS
jgi:FkbM family methyltransferase